MPDICSLINNKYGDMYDMFGYFLGNKKVERVLKRDHGYNKVSQNGLGYLVKD